MPFIYLQDRQNAGCKCPRVLVVTAKKKKRCSDNEWQRDGGEARHERATAQTETTKNWCTVSVPSVLQSDTRHHHPAGDGGTAAVVAMGERREMPHVYARTASHIYRLLLMAATKTAQLAILEGCEIIFYHHHHHQDVVSIS